MVIRHSNPWESTTRSGLVSVGDHKLYVSTSGPPRVAGKPVVIFFTGGGSPVAAHVRLQRILSGIVRVYFYDRSGYDFSERAPGQETITARDTARELQVLLTTGIRVMPPYILVGISYGGIIARTFLDIQRSHDDVVGMVLAETATELMFELFPHVPDLALEKIADGIDFAKLTHLREELGLTDEEWDRALDAIARTQPAAAAEDNHGSGRALANLRQYQHQPLGSRPLSVIRCNMASDFRLLYNAGVNRGQGTEEERSKAKAFIDTLELFDDELRATQLRLSRVHRYVHVPECGHDGPIRRPQILATEIQWILDVLEAEPPSGANKTKASD